MKKPIKFKRLNQGDRIVRLTINWSGGWTPAADAGRAAGAAQAGSMTAAALLCASLFFTSLTFSGVAQAENTQAVTGANAGVPVVSPLTIDDLGFTGAMDGDLFSDSRAGAPSRAYRISSGSLLAGSDSASSLTASSMIEVESSQSAGPGSVGSPNSGRGSGLVLDSRFTGFSGDPDDSDAVKVRRFSTAIQSSDGAVTVGNDWSNFQDFLGHSVLDSGPGSAVGDGRNTMLLGYGSAGSAGVTARQLRWQPAGELSNFSVAVENDLRSTLADDSGEAVALSGSSSPNLVLSWRSDADSGSLYSVSALGSQLDFEGADQSEDEVGWGLNLAGGWRFGDLVAALSVTLGNSIDSLILGRLGDANTAAAASKVSGTDQSLNLNPSLSYQLDSESNLHLSLNRFHTGTANAAHGVDTLDTIHLGYSWNPWPSTRFGIEFVGKDVDGRSTMDDSNAVNFAASKRF